MKKETKKSNVDFTALAIIIAIPVMILYVVYGIGYRNGAKNAEKAIADETKAEEKEEEKEKKKNEPAKYDVPIYGLDMSAFQKDVYGKVLTSSDADFVICRAAVGKTVDPTCDKMYQKAKKLGKQVGVYFAPYTDSCDAGEYAEWCVAMTEGYIGESLIILDMENSKSHPDNVSPVWALDFLKAFEHYTGVRPIIYLNLDTVKNYNWSKVVDNGNELWLAAYGSNNGKLHDPPTHVPYWGKDGISIYQYTSKLDVAGIKVDGNICYKGSEWWSAMTTPTA